MSSSFNLTFNSSDKLPVYRYVLHPNLKSTRQDLNPHIPPVEHRPICSHVNCNEPQAITSTAKSGKPIYRKICNIHHQATLCIRHGVKSSKSIAAKRQNKTDAEYYFEKRLSLLGYGGVHKTIERYYFLFNL